MRNILLSLEDYPIYIAGNINDIKASGLITINGYYEVDCPYSEKVNEAYKNIKNIRETY